MRCCHRISDCNRPTRTMAGCRLVKEVIQSSTSMDRSVLQAQSNRCYAISSRRSQAYLPNGFFSWISFVGWCWCWLFVSQHDVHHERRVATLFLAFPIPWIPVAAAAAVNAVPSLAYGDDDDDDDDRYDEDDDDSSLDGPTCYARGQKLFQKRQYDRAAMQLWKAVLLHGNTPQHRSYDVQAVFQAFMQCYILQGRMADGLAFVAMESFRRGQIDMGRNYLQQSLEVDPMNEAARAVQHEFPFAGDMKTSHPGGSDNTQDAAKQNSDLAGKTPEQLYEIASKHFSDKEYEACADIFEISCYRSGYRLGPSCVNAAYCRNKIADFGFNGTGFQQDMDRVARLIQKETLQYRLSTTNIKSKQRDSVDTDIAVDNGGFVQDDSIRFNQFQWQRATSVHPHMTLGFPIEPLLKRYVSESVAYLDEKMARASQAINGGIPPLPPGLPYTVEEHRTRFVAEIATAIPDKRSAVYKIRVGFVGSGFNSKAVLFLSQDMFRFFDGDRFEIHIFSFGPADSPGFIQHGMRGVDWRERVKANVDRFHDVQAMKLDHVKAARYIYKHGIHILIEWDGYARQGERAQGLFALRPAPIQILHQEYLGTSGGLYVDYLFTDPISSPPELQHLYTEKLIYMPNHFFSKGHAYQQEVKRPTYEYAPAKVPYKLGTGSPQENRCLAPRNVGPTIASFVYCNFNKILKSNPETFRSWLRVLREVPNSMLCLMENPTIAIPYVRRFVHEAAGSSNNNSDPHSFLPGDGDELNSRIHFLPWQANPFDHQMRNQDFCNVMLDSYPYNGHTVAQDALYGGVPIVTRSDGQDMSSRVTTSANDVLGLTALNAYEGLQQYEQIAITLGKNEIFYNETRTRLVASCLQRNPMHPYWDVSRYVKNFETGLTMAWENFLASRALDHIYIVESEEAARGTYDDEIREHPPQGRKRSKPPHRRITVAEEL